MRRLGFAFPLSGGGAFLKGKIMENVVDRETAEQEFERFAGAARLKLDGFRNEKDAKDLEENREFFLDCVMGGSITVDEEGWPTVIVEGDLLKEVRFPRRPKGFDRCAMDKVSDKEPNSKLYAWVGSCVGIASAKLKSLEEPDWAKVWCTFQLFLDQRT
jgi:hypothetical protein